MDLDSIPPGSDELFRRTALKDAGFSDAEIDQMRRSGLLVAVRRGVYRRADAAELASTDAHVLRCRAVIPSLSPDAVFRHVTAAILLGLPLWLVPLDRLHVIRDRPGGGRLRPGLHVHTAPLPDDDVVQLDGIRLTSAARTVADLARTLPTEQALIAADGALHRAVKARRANRHDPGATTKDEATAVLARFAGRRGSAAAGRLVASADPLCESPGETRSRYRMHLAGLPPPVTQWIVPGTGHRTDFAWPELGVVGEFDGRIKYTRGLLRPGETLEEVVWREKRREDEIRDTGRTVVRWVWSEIGEAMIARLRPRLVG
ncbi:type IV toxin-antitoxin system AbiEi family antitoxin domain-containing protein [Pseudonocardia sp. C8]|uniref:type IV toxin-antitoxin system AbiEi family antitoxin domain-containing protein n=1 Tax=Pseudonocardia sp. C8 TaxID=2762759 RepID=UPI001643100F|nr:type IV toxin-antitoxin system AbiEi family antitoxin domain-containing protein [Pseudonocardia sp. C8]MBC3194358.1 type IV toxin-antitoxin system AbiEi family antitoxin domain-containing protein [Pseudonocardia sp. C8]